MNSREKCESKENLQEKTKVNWLERLAKGTRSNVQKRAISEHCNDYASLNCLKCGKCWGKKSK